MDIDIKKLQELHEFSENIKILYVEDNEKVRISTYDTLTKIFKNIITAVDGLDGLEKFENDDIDLIITDITMPNMNGIEMVSKIRQKNDDIPVLIVSAYNEAEYFIETIKLGVEGYLLKPIELDQLIKVLSRTVEKIKMKKELQEYQKNLELKVQEQLEHIQVQNEIIKNREKFAAMGEMIDAITHQFKQPLGIMRLRTDEIKYLMKKEEFNIQESLESINKQIDFSVNTIEEFRNFFRTDLKKECLNIKYLFDSVLGLIKDELIQYNVQTIIDIEESLCARINSSEFKHVLLNLINNAKDALNERDIKDKQVILTGQKNNNSIYLSIEDNAGGIKEEIIDKIFEPNFTTKSQDKGTGIGLHISKMILEKEDATIEVQNTSLGAKFTITLTH